MLLIATAVALSLATVKIPNGVLELPAGCTSPAEIRIMVDSYLGFIACNENRTTIMVEGYPSGGTPCSGTDAAQFTSRHGAPLSVCLIDRIDGVSKKRVETMIVEIGSGALRVDVKDSRDALLLLQLASSYRPDRRQ